MITAQFVSLLVDSEPFTRAYPPEHAKPNTDVEAEAAADPAAFTVLNIGPNVGRNAQPAT